VEGLLPAAALLALQWPGYATTSFDVTLKGQPAVIQPWKGWCPKFLGLADFPGGVGGEVGVYKRVTGHPRAANLSQIPSMLAGLIQQALSTLSDVQPPQRPRQHRSGDARRSRRRARR
jgi:hypothetical protein